MRWWEKLLFGAIVGQSLAYAYVKGWIPRPEAVEVRLAIYAVLGLAIAFLIPNKKKDPS